jgi:hypothetical protein
MLKRQTLILFPLLTVIIFFSSCSHTVVYTSSWQSNDFNVLRKSETGEPLRFFDKKSKLQYAISNDYKNVYICIKATDRQSQIKIIRAGMTVGIDTLMKKKPQVEILFPFSGSHQKNSSSTENKKDWHKSDSSSLNLRKQFMSQYNEIHLSGFKTPIDGVLPLHNDYGISVNIMWDTLNIMYYKAIIPFKTFYKDSLTTSDSTKILDFSVTVNALAMQHSNGGESGSHGGGMHGGGGGMGGGMHGGGGGMGGGMHGGGGHSETSGSGMDDRSSLFETTNFNSRIKLAIRPQ